MGCHSLLQGIFATQGSNPSLLHCGWVLYWLNPQGSPERRVVFSKLGTLMPVISENQIFTDRLSRYWVASKVMLKILQARLQQHVNRELPDVQAGFRKGRGTRDQIANIHWIIEKAREFQKISISALLTMPKPSTVWITVNCGKFLKEMGIPDHLTCLLRNLYAGQEATVRTGHGTTAKGVRQGCMLSPCLFNLCAEDIMRNVGLEEAQAGIKISGRISITSDMQMTPPLWQRVKRN